VEDLFSKYRISEALMVIYKLFWDEFSGWYLEMIKPAYGEPIDRVTFDKTLAFFDNLLKLLHPFMPFITEELWQALYERKEGESIMVQKITFDKKAGDNLIADLELVKGVISGIRTIRLQKNIMQKESLELKVIGINPVEIYNSVICKMANLSSIESIEAKPEGAASYMVETTEYVIPINNMIDIEGEIIRMEAELKHKESFLESVLKKLNNARFVAKAPANVIEMERKKQADAESIIQSLKESIKTLKK